MLQQVFGESTASNNAGWLRRKLSESPDNVHGQCRSRVVRARDSGAAIWNRPLIMLGVGEEAGDEELAAAEAAEGQGEAGGCTGGLQPPGFVKREADVEMGMLEAAGAAQGFRSSDGSVRPQHHAHRSLKRSCTEASQNFRERQQQQQRRAQEPCSSGAFVNSSSMPGRVIHSDELRDDWVGCQVMVFWPADNRWWAAAICGLSTATQQLQLLYSDQTEEVVAGQDFDFARSTSVSFGVSYGGSGVSHAAGCASVSGSGSGSGSGTTVDFEELAAKRSCCEPSINNTGSDGSNPGFYAAEQQQQGPQASQLGAWFASQQRQQQQLQLQMQANLQLQQQVQMQIQHQVAAHMSMQQAAGQVMQLKQPALSSPFAGGGGPAAAAPTGFTSSQQQAAAAAAAASAAFKLPQLNLQAPVGALQPASVNEIDGLLTKASRDIFELEDLAAAAGIGSIDGMEGMEEDAIAAASGNNSSLCESMADELAVAGLEAQDAAGYYMFGAAGSPTPGEQQELQQLQQQALRQGAAAAAGAGAGAGAGGCQGLVHAAGVQGMVRGGAAVAAAACGNAIQLAGNGCKVAQAPCESSFAHMFDFY
ncbi:hypothetical protein COO60DRAFT_1641960 [Scenedesmus sp. NREL 46B-D3]|nr:hypothetical protein COO60DRAFT_1641960 [Scenedesmus sp. NREL 46B-D3]